MPRRMVRVIVNPISGRGQDRRLLNGLRIHLGLRHFPVEVLRTEGVGHARRLAAETPDDAHCVVSIGGDGTHREVIAGLVGRPVPVAVVPSGTENVFARTFRLTGTLREIMDLVQRGRAVALDVGQADLSAVALRPVRRSPGAPGAKPEAGAKADGHPFVLFSGVGFDAEVTRRVHQRRRGPIDRAAYYGPAWRLWWGYRFPRLRVTVDGRTVTEEAGIVVVANTPRYADRLRVAPQARADDGLLDVVCYRTRSRWAMLRQFAETKLGWHLRDADVRLERGRCVEVACDQQPVPVQADGDAIGSTPVTYTLHPRAVRILLRPREEKQEE